MSNRRVRALRLGIMVLALTLAACGVTPARGPGATASVTPAPTPSPTPESYPMPAIYAVPYQDTVYGFAPQTGRIIWRAKTGATNIFTLSAPVSNAIYGSSEMGAFALNAQTGAFLWRDAQLLPEAMPVVANGVVYYRSGQDGLTALTAQTGAQLWQFDGGPGAGDGYAITYPPLVTDSVVYVGRSSLYALDRQTGKQLWSFTDGPGHYQTPSGQAITSEPFSVGAISLQGNILYFSAGNRAFYAVKTANGTLAWKYQTSGAADSATADGVAYVNYGTNAWDNTVGAFDAPTGRPLWQRVFGTQEIPRMLLASDNRLYCSTDTGALVALNPANGTTIWQTSFNIPIYLDSLAGTAQSFIARGVVYILGGGQVQAVRLTDGKALWRWADVNASSEGDGGVEIGGGLLFDTVQLYADNPEPPTVYAVNIMTGAVAWKYSFGAIVKS